MRYAYRHADDPKEQKIKKSNDETLRPYKRTWPGNMLSDKKFAYEYVEE